VTTKIPRRVDKLVLHRRPLKSLVYMSGFEHSAVVEINTVAAQILAMCDGTTSVGVISEKMADIYSDKPERTLPVIAKFLEGAIERGHVELLSHPQPTCAAVVGSHEYWVPVLAALEITQRCNLECRHCYVDATIESRIEPNESQWICIMERFAHEGTPFLFLSGGEPLIHPGFRNILKQASKLFSSVHIATNGLAISRKIVGYLEQYSNLAFQISMDGVGETHNWFRKHDQSFQRVRSAIELLSRSGKPVMVAMTVTPRNIDQMELVVNCAREWGAQGVRFGTVFSFGRAMQEELHLSESDKDKFNDSLAALSQKYGGDDFLLTEHRLESQFGAQADQELLTLDNCGAGYYMCTVAPTGDVMPCPVLRHSFGNLFNEPFETVFGAEGAGLWAQRPAPSEKTCEDCQYATECYGCHAAALTMQKDVEECNWIKAAFSESIK